MQLLEENYTFSRDNILATPATPGVYIFLSGNLSVIYVGKSVSIRNRLLSYKSPAVEGKTAKMVLEAKYFSYLLVDSELEALLLEAKLVKKFMPQYNIQLKDDKHPLYIRITTDKYPQILTARKIDANNANSSFYGPFPSSGNVKTVLKQLRRIFPYAQHYPVKRACLYNQMHLCDPCPSIIEKISDSSQKGIQLKKYRQNIRNIKNILDGNIGKIIKSYQHKVKTLVKNERFEDARIVQDQISKLYYITQPIISADEFLKNPNLLEDLRETELFELTQIVSKQIKIYNKIQRIECYDVAHFSGTNTTASMVTFINGEADKALYRHFKVNSARNADDIDSMREIAKRRENHFSDWGKPDLILVDGGKAQVGIFWSVFNKYLIPTLGIAKRYETLIIPKISRSKLIYAEIVLPRGNALNLLQRLRNEAHRFARRYHHHLVKKTLFN